jgi:hypothetical protein
MKTAPDQFTVLLEPKYTAPKRQRTRSFDLTALNSTGSNERRRRDAAPAESPPFRSLSREIFSSRLSGEFIKEAVVFGWLMLVAAWPLSVTLDQLGTMMISPPRW